MRRIALLVFLLAPSLSAVVRPLVIGDSQSEEYAFEFPFSAPDSNPAVANTRNWVEILAAHRPGDFNFGNYNSLLLSYPDARNGGFARNFGIPGAESGTWEDIVQSSFSNSPEFLTTKIAFLEKLTDTDGQGQFTTDVVVLFLGGNDVNSDYGDLYNDAPKAGFFSNIESRFASIFTFIRDSRPSVPIIFLTVPDVGATLDVQDDHPDPDKRAVASGHIATLNDLLTTLALSHGATVVDLYRLTQQILDPAPIFFGGIEMLRAAAPENPPDHLFCKDGFHPSTSAQALFANAIIEGINSALGETIAPFASRELLADVLGLDPDQPYLDWIAGFPGANPDMLADDDRDGLPQIGEFALHGHPLQSGDLTTPRATPTGATLTYHPDPDAARLVDTHPEQSIDLASWGPVPSGDLETLPGGGIEVTLPTESGAYARLRFLLRP